MSEPPYALVGDIGGTNARFGLAALNGGPLCLIRSLPCADYRCIEDAIADYLGGIEGKRVEIACFAVAAMVGGSHIQMTNNAWRFGVEDVRRRFGWREFQLINDFSAQALGSLDIDADHCWQLSAGRGRQVDPRAPRLVMGPGTGLGMAGLVPAGGGWVTLPSEGGHVGFSPSDETDIAVLEVLQARFHRVSVERILSGPGLVNLYQAMAHIRRTAARFGAPEQIVEAALARSDALAVDTLNRFCQILGRVAGDAVLTMGSTGGVYLCGGILPRMLEFLSASGFQLAFADKGRMRALVEQMPVYVITDKYTGLRGAAAALRGAPDSTS
ncbi:glucokinase [Marinobacter salinisoli]|uniref:Glucokinase n=1 Tax=Marinobacter salinisoli TaxID=2769486 RepID=A0ABX7MN83_9GAMM|nr:glucokinase [Marinobacter salinisoli]QSP93544.1 glucokinase [Marinobacter salinisoli]